MRGRALLATVAVAATMASACDWGAHRFGPERAAYNPGEDVVGTGNVADLEEAWSATLDPLSTSVDPIVAGGRVFVAANEGGGGGGGSRLLAFDARSGDQLWARDYPGTGDPAQLNSVVTVSAHEGELYVGRTFGSTLGELSALDAATGDVLWASDGLAVQHPVMAGDLLYGAYLDGTSGFTAGVAAFDPADGSIVWQSPPGPTEPHHVSVANGLAVVTHGRSVDIYDAAGTSGCTPRPDEPTVCGPLWTGVMPATVDMAAITDRTAYVTAADGTLGVFPLGGCSFARCEPMWTGQAGAAAGPTVAQAPAVGEGVVLVTGADGLAAFPVNGCGQSTCAPLWTGDLGGGDDSAPSIANGVAYVGASDSRLLAFALDGCGAATCPPLWSTTLDPGSADGAVNGSPAISRGRVYAGEDGVLRAFALPG